jgi:hypothetical protein
VLSFAFLTIPALGSIFHQPMNTKKRAGLKKPALFIYFNLFIPDTVLPY